MVNSISSTYNNFGVVSGGSSATTTQSNKNTITQAVAKNNKAASYQNTPIDTKKANSKVSDRFEKTQIDKTVEQLYNKIDGSNVESKINYNKQLGIYVVKMIDKKTGDVVNQVPSESMIKVKEQIRNIIPARQPQKLL